MWSDVIDGNNIALGSAAGELDYTDRRVYTNLSDDTNVTLADVPISGITDAAPFGVVAGDKISPSNGAALTADVMARKGISA